MFYKETAFQETAIGKIPKDWRSFHLGDSEVSGAIFYGITAKATEKNTGLKMLRTTDIKDYSAEWDELPFCEITERRNAVGRYELRKGDIIVARAGTVGVSVLVDRDLSNVIFGSYLIKVKLKPQMLPNFVHYFMQSKPYWRHLERAQGSTLKNINLPILKSLSLPVPSLMEQQRIVEVLSCIDLAIQKTCEVIPKTERLKKGLMQQLLTKGIGHKEYKQTPIGTIPKEWDVVKYEQANERIFVGIATSSTKHFCDQGIPLIRNQNIREGSLDLGDLVYITEKFSEMNRSRMLKENDIVTVRTGYPGLSCKVTKEMEGWHTFTTLIGRPITSQFSPDYLVCVLNSPLARSQILRLQAGLAQQNLNVKWIANLRIPKPPMEEQEKISSILKAISEKTEAEKKVEAKLRRIKLALMDLLLSGKVRVKVD